MTWTFAYGAPAPNQSVTRELTEAGGRTVTWRVDGAATVQFSINGRSDEAAGIVELATDLTVFRDHVKMFSGRIGPENDTLDADKHVAQFAAVDYRGMLAYHGQVADRRFDGVDQATIVDTVIDDDAALTGRDWGIDTAGIGTGASGQLRDVTFPAGETLAKSIGDLGRLLNGFEWEIDADLVLNRWYPQRGSDNGVKIDYGGLAQSVSRRLAPASFGNYAVALGSDETSPSIAAAGDLATDLRGVWQQVLSASSVSSQDTLDDKAAWLLDQTGTLRPDYGVVLAPDRWEGPDHIWIGDTVELVVKSGRLNERSAHRVVELAVAISDDGDETVTLKLVQA